MAIYNLQNPLLQIDTGNPRTFLYNASLSPISIYAGQGENQVLGQRYSDVVNKSAANPGGSPAIYMLVKYQSTGNPAPVAGPAPVYWTDNTFTTVTGVNSEAFVGGNLLAGWLLPNTTDMPSLTNALLNGSQCLIQVAGYCKGAYAPTTTGAVGATVSGSAGNWTSTGTAQGTAPLMASFGIQLTAAAGGLCDMLIHTDII
jgi:hypothetical protein